MTFYIFITKKDTKIRFLKTFNLDLINLYEKSEAHYRFIFDLFFKAWKRNVVKTQ